MNLQNHKIKDQYIEITVFLYTGFWKRVFAMTSVFSWENYIYLCPVSFCTPSTNLPVIPGTSWFPTFAFESPMMKRISFLGVSFRWSCRSPQNHSISFLQHYWLGPRLGLPWYWMVCLGNDQWSSCHFWDCTQILLSASLVDYEGYSISSKGFLLA